ncbi:MAG TPA: hypothetical protein DDW76_26545 [Cyanobacteria bacterium UBA11369]|nr:hypothetical protein [Cyanobacteria bacterium UBA11368]HBE52230.1 hypothetical protein [Cyanobacteria bacterium UBA11369]
MQKPAFFKKPDFFSQVGAGLISSQVVETLHVTSLLVWLMVFTVWVLPVPFNRFANCVDQPAERAMQMQPDMI